MNLLYQNYQSMASKCLLDMNSMYQNYNIIASKIIKRSFSQGKKVQDITEQIKKCPNPHEKKCMEQDAAKKKEEKEKAKGEKKKEPEVRRINVSLQGASCKAAVAAALLLKQHPLIKKIYMYDQCLNTNIAGDLNSIDSSAKVEAYCGEKIPYSMRAADIVVLLDKDEKNENIKKKYEKSYLRVKKFAHSCNLLCPKAIIVVCVDPVCHMTCLVQSIIEDSPFYHPSRLLGCITSLQAAINTIVANNLNLDPTSVHVPILGGPDLESAVPLLSLMTPDPGLCPQDQVAFYELIKKEYTKSLTQLMKRNSTLNEGYAIGKLCITIAKGLNEHPDALASVLARTTSICPLRYLVSTVKFGKNGIYHNYGIPKLTPFELQELEKSLLLLEKREKIMGKLRTKILKQFKKCGKNVCS